MIQSHPTPKALADAVARHIVACAAEAIAARGRFVIALSGGSTPRAAYGRLASSDLSHQVDWQRTHVIWGDERCVPPDDPRSNYGVAKETLLDRVPIPGNQIHRIKCEVDPEPAAADYERELRSLLEPWAAGDAEHEARHPEGIRKASHPERQRRMIDHLDLVLLGLGEDGHTASLFPGQPAVHEAERWVLAVPSPAGDLWRVTLTPAVLNLARNVTFVVSGAGKSLRLAQVLEGPFNPDVLPAQAIRPVQGGLTWMVDETAAGHLRLHRVST